MRKYGAKANYRRAVMRLPDPNCRMADNKPIITPGSESACGLLDTKYGSA